MTEIHFFILLALGTVLAVLLLILFLRKPKLETPADVNARLGLLEQASQGLLQAVSRNEGGMQRIEEQLRGFTQATTAAMATSKSALDEQLERTVGEARNGRSDLNQAFQAFEGRLGQQVAALSNSVGERVTELQRTTTVSLEASRKLVDEKLGQTLEEGRSGRTELTSAFNAFEVKLEQRFGSFDTSLSARFEALQSALTGRLDAVSKALMDLLTQAQTDAANARNETAQALAKFRTEMTEHLGTVAQETGMSRQALADSAAAFETRIQERFEALTGATRGTLDSLKSDITNQLGVMSTAMKEQLEGNGNQIRNQFATLQDTVAQQLSAMAQGSQSNSEQLRTESPPFF